MSPSSQLKSWGSKASSFATHPFKKPTKLAILQNYKHHTFEALHRFAASSNLNDSTAIPYRAITGFSLCSNSHREKPVFITGNPSSHCRDPIFITGISL